MRIDVRPMGEQALLVEVTSLDDVLVLDAALRESLASMPGIELVAAARTVLVQGQDDVDLSSLAERIRLVAQGIRTPHDVPGDPAAAGAMPENAASENALPEDADVVEIAVRYDGPDLGEVAEHLGVSEEDVVARHTGAVWRVAFGGFAPGFAYLVCGGSGLVVPRRDSPRTRVPAGAVGLAGEFSGIYPRASPGGWQLIGSTDAVLWDLERDPPALLQPGTWVRFVADGGSSAHGAPGARGNSRTEGSTSGH
ncbi:MAG: allophanate hydrolase subunit 1 [Actinomycetia bacterium]|nr:allophanate hydrolase subunit 1 [Actinomycetes bacterium]